MPAVSWKACNHSSLFLLGKTGNGTNHSHMLKKHDNMKSHAAAKIPKIRCLFTGFPAAIGGLVPWFVLVKLTAIAFQLLKSRRDAPSACQLPSCTFISAVMECGLGAIDLYRKFSGWDGVPHGAATRIRNQPRAQINQAACDGKLDSFTQLSSESRYAIRAPVGSDDRRNQLQFCAFENFVCKEPVPTSDPGR